MRRPVVATAVLCLAMAAAQPASAAWQTSKAGTATAKGGVLGVVTDVACTPAGVITWSAVTGATGYDVAWLDNNGNNFRPAIRVAGTTHDAKASIRQVSVRAGAGTKWFSAATVRTCS